MRHAKSDWSGPQISDFERPINRRGTRNAIRIGQWMNENNYIPQKIISSPALRTKETIELVTEQISKFNLEDLTYEDELYLAGFTQLIEFINTYKDKVQSLMLVGHNPGIENLVNYLCDRSGNKEIIVTTANLFIFKFSSDSFNTAVDTIKLVEAIKPRELN
jgi:phosphohistidine phosphatase|tara:strand:+ start:81 stop:566 length:486 start_codon:yes stop_codon:yes gene_type:complete